MKTISFRLLLLVSVLLYETCANFLFAQPTPTKEKSEAPKNKPQVLYFINDRLDSSKFSYITTILVKGAEGRATIQELYYSLKKKAIAAGGNGYKKPFFNVRNNTLQAEVYSLSEPGVRENLSFEEPNCIFIFGLERAGNKKRTFYINEEKKQLNAGEYYKSVIPEGKNIQISKGGLFNSARNIDWKVEGVATYLALNGVEIVDPQYSGPNNLAISPAGIMLIEQGLGRLYMRLLKPSEESK